MKIFFVHSFKKRLLENLLKKAIELNDTQMCHCIIRNVQILEEYQAVDCLRYFLKYFKHYRLVNFILCL
jgi:hypothetical protein